MTFTNRYSITTNEKREPNWKKSTPHTQPYPYIEIKMIPNKILRVKEKEKHNCIFADQRKNKQ